MSREDAAEHPSETVTRIAQSRPTARGVFNLACLALSSPMFIGMGIVICAGMLQVATSAYDPGFLALLTAVAFILVALAIGTSWRTMNLCLSLRSGAEYLEIRDGVLIHRTAFTLAQERLTNIGKVVYRNEKVVILRADGSGFTSLVPLIFRDFDGSLEQRVREAVEQAKSTPDCKSETLASPTNTAAAAVPHQTSANRGFALICLGSLAIVLPLALNIWWNAPRLATGPVRHPVTETDPR